MLKNARIGKMIRLVERHAGLTEIAAVENFETRDTSLRCPLWCLLDEKPVLPFAFNRKWIGIPTGSRLLQFDESVDEKRPIGRFVFAPERDERPLAPPGTAPYPNTHAVRRSR